VLHQIAPEIDIVRVPILSVPKKKALKAVWSVEAAEDLKAVHNLDVEQELIDAMAQEIARGVDEEILKTTCFHRILETAEEAKRKAREEAERRKEAIWRSTFSIIGRRYLDPEEARTEDESEIEVVERKIIVVVPDLPFGLGHRRVLI
jgi:hypothetical protein